MRYSFLDMKIVLFEQAYGLAIPVIAYVRFDNTGDRYISCIKLFGRFIDDLPICLWVFREIKKSSRKGPTSGRRDIIKREDS